MIAVAALERVLPVAVGAGRVLGEARRELVPELLVEAAEIAVLEALDGVDLLQVAHGGLPLPVS